MTFDFSAGSLALCLVDTFGDRGGAGVERLASPDDLRRWVKQASVVDAEDIAPDVRDLGKYRELREAVHRVARAVIDGGLAPAEDVATINRCALLPAPHPQLVDGRVRLRAEKPFLAGLSAIAADAIRVLTPPASARIRSCPECQMIFLDTSRPGRRRWCSSASGCGNRAKVRAHRARRAAQAAEGGEGR